MEIIYKLPPERWKEYRDLRIQSLTESPRVFGKNKKDLYVEKRHLVDHWVNILKDPYNEIIFIENEDAELVGMVRIHSRLIIEPKVQIIGIISQFFVRKKFRNQKIGLSLFKNSIEYCTAKQTSEIFLNVVLGQKRAYQMYKKFGFKTTSWGFNIKKLILYRNMSLKI